MTEKVTIEFVRSTEEHVDVMLGFGRRLQAGSASTKSNLLRGLLGGVAIGIIGTLLVRMLDLEAIASNMTADRVQMLIWILLMLILFIAFLLAWYPRALANYRKAMVDRLAKDQKVVISADSKSVVAEGPANRFQMDWSEVRAISKRNGRLELETEALIVYVPRRAFANDDEFDRVATMLETLRDNAAV